MKLAKYLVVGFLGASVFVGSAARAQETLTLLPNFTDADFVSGGYQAAETFVAEGRRGNNAANGDHEMVVFPGNGNFSGQNQNFPWHTGIDASSVIPYDFSLTLDRPNGVITFTMTNSLNNTEYKIVESNYAKSKDTNLLFLRARAGTGFTRIENLTYKNTTTNTVLSGLPTTFEANASDPTAYLSISAINGSFVMTGRASIFTTGTGGSSNAFEFKGINWDAPIGGNAAVPEPGAVSFAVAFAGLLGVAGVRARRKG